MKVLWLTLALLLSGCSSPPGRPDLPYGAWFIGTTAPDYMETWVESIDVIDRRGWIYVDVSGGVSSMRRSKALDGNPAGWPKRAGRGAGQHMNGIDLPDWIQVRWQSLVEPQTYDAGIRIPRWVHEEMLKPHRAYCHFDGKEIDDLYRDSITLGLAPGGIVKVWLTGPCLSDIEITRYQASISKVGPYGGLSGGKHRPLDDISKAYIERHGVPYGSW